MNEKQLKEVNKIWKKLYEKDIADILNKPLWKYKLEKKFWEIVNLFRK